MSVLRPRRKILRLWQTGGDRFRDFSPSDCRLKAFGSLLVKPMKKGEVHTEVRVNDAIVWIGCTIGSFHRGTIAPTRQFWSAPGFNIGESLPKKESEASSS